MAIQRQLFDSQGLLELQYGDMDMMARFADLVGRGGRVQFGPAPSWAGRTKFTMQISGEEIQGESITQLRADMEETRSWDARDFSNWVKLQRADPAKGRTTWRFEGDSLIADTPNMQVTLDEGGPRVKVEIPPRATTVVPPIDEPEAVTKRIDRFFNRTRTGSSRYVTDDSGVVYEAYPLRLWTTKIHVLPSTINPLKKRRATPKPKPRTKKGTPQSPKPWELPDKEPVATGSYWWFDGYLKVATPFDHDFKELANNMGGRWRGSYWTFDPSIAPLVLGVIQETFGADPTPAVFKGEETQAPINPFSPYAAPFKGKGFFAYAKSGDPSKAKRISEEKAASYILRKNRANESLWWVPGRVVNNKIADFRKYGFRRLRPLIDKGRASFGGFE